MSGMIFFGMDASTHKSMHTSINSFNWDVLGDLIDLALASQYPHIHRIIKSEEAVALSYYYFNELDESEFKTTIKVIRDEISKWNDPSPWQQRAKQVWENVCEPWILRDRRLKS